MGSERDNMSNIVAISWLSLFSITMGDEKFLAACCIVCVPWRIAGVAADWRIAVAAALLERLRNAVLVNGMVVVVVCAYAGYALMN